MYFGGFRPAEAVGLVKTDLNLPEQGWGSVLLHRTRPSVGKQRTDSGETYDDRGLKDRPVEDVRRVPIPPHLVAVLHEHLATFGTTDDGRPFFSEKGLGRPVLDLLLRLAGSPVPCTSSVRGLLTARDSAVRPLAL